VDDPWWGWRVVVWGWELNKNTTKKKTNFVFRKKNCAGWKGGWEEGREKTKKKQTKRQKDGNRLGLLPGIGDQKKTKSTKKKVEKPQRWCRRFILEKKSRRHRSEEGNKMCNKDEAE